MKKVFNCSGSGKREAQKEQNVANVEAAGSCVTGACTHIFASNRYWVWDFATGFGHTFVAKGSNISAVTMNHDGPQSQNTAFSSWLQAGGNLVFKLFLLSSCSQKADFQHVSRRFQAGFKPASNLISSLFQAFPAISSYLKWPRS